MLAQRWSQVDPASGLIHPDAIAVARDLEGSGYTQHNPDDLDDHEGIVAVSGADGSHAAARYYRQHEPGEHGQRAQHVIESWPESPFAERIAYADTLREHVPGKSVSRLGLFRLNAPEHLDDIMALYNGRAQRHMDEAKQQ